MRSHHLPSVYRTQLLGLIIKFFEFRDVRGKLKPRLRGCSAAKSTQDSRILKPLFSLFYASHSFRGGFCMRKRLWTSLLRAAGDNAIMSLTLRVNNNPFRR